ncbi:hypothetical protein SFRURICE_015439 [Spodoptera frugiperda]|nr:hypothetical protein SFRURICE_015439 [Spodoptera frugiperda]
MPSDNILDRAASLFDEVEVLNYDVLTPTDSQMRSEAVSCEQARRGRSDWLALNQHNLVGEAPALITQRRYAERSARRPEGSARGCSAELPATTTADFQRTVPNLAEYSTCLPPNRVASLSLTLTVIWSVYFTLNENETRARSVLSLAGTNEPTNESAERVFVSFSFNIWNRFVRLVTLSGIFPQKHVPYKYNKKK